MKTSYLSPTVWLSESLEGRTWLPLLSWYQASIGQSQMSRPRGRFARSKARQRDSLRHQIPSPCPHSPLTGFTLIGALLIFSRVFSKNRHPRKLHCTFLTFFSQGSFYWSRLNPLPDRKMIKHLHLITFSRHYDFLAKTPSWMTTAITFSRRNKTAERRGR